MLKRFFRSNSLVVALLMILVGLQVGEFFTAPLSIGAWVKTKVGMMLVERQVRQVYSLGGEEDVESMCSVPIVVLGIPYTVAYYEGIVFDERGRLRVVKGAIQAHPSMVEADLCCEMHYYDAVYLTEVRQRLIRMMAKPLVRPSSMDDFRWH